MTRREFERAYAARSKVGVQSLRSWRRVYPCNCGNESCEGWQSASPVLYWADRIYRESKPLKRFGMWLVLNFYRVRMWRLH